MSKSYLCRRTLELLAFRGDRDTGRRVLLPVGVGQFAGSAVLCVG